MSRSVLRAAIGSVVVAVIVIVGYGVLGPDDEDRARSAAARGDWAEASARARRWVERNPNEIEAHRLSGLASANLGRIDDARDSFLKVGADGLKAEDFAALARSWGDQDRALSSWCAWEAARRLAPEDSGVAQGQSRVWETLRRSPDDAKLIETLGAIGPASALGGLAFGLTDPALSDPLVRLGLADRRREDIATLTSSVAARNLLTRLLLEAGRPAQAESLAQSGTMNGETWWLLSRSQLQRGDFSAAQKALERSEELRGGKGESWSESEPSPYVGAARCRDCHEGLFRAQQSSRHAVTVRVGPDSVADIEIFPDHPIPDPSRPEFPHRFHRDPATKQVRVSVETDGGRFEGLVEYLMGSGRHGRTAVVRDSQGIYHEHRISWYRNEGGKPPVWDATNVMHRPASPMEHLGRVLSEPTVRRCVHCHTTHFPSLDPAKRDGPEARDLGIGCERCHGPGLHHVQAVQAEWPDLAIAFGFDSPSSDRMELCARCHSAGPEASPFAAEFVRFQSTTLKLSPCYQKSAGKLDCVDCHDPHRDAEAPIASYDAKCLECHRPRTSPAAVVCKVSPDRDCVRCHMPKRPETAPHTTYTEHQIRVYR